MTLDGELRVLATGLHDRVVDFSAFQKESGAETAFRWLSLSGDYDRKIAVWALKQYKIPQEYTLKSTSGMTLGKISLLGLPSEDDEPSFTESFEKLSKLGLKLNPESERTLMYCQEKNCHSLYAIRLLVQKKTGQDIDLRKMYFIQKHNLKEGTFECEPEEIKGELPTKFLTEGKAHYGVAPDVFGKERKYNLDVLLIGVKGNEGLLNISTQDMFSGRKSSLPNTKEAVRILRVLAKHTLY